MKKKIPELVAPAGNWPSLRAAVKNGADAVYFGIKGMNMRHQASNFDILEIKKVMEYLKENGKKGYLALNVVVMDTDVARVKKILQQAKKNKVDGVILWDMSVLSLAKKSGLRIHISTQASISNLKALEFFSRLGARRAVLARECTLEDIRRIVRNRSKQKIKCEIETFVHGAMCVSISGRCFLSQQAFRRSANKGDCLQPCRREFRIKDVDDDSEYILGKDYVLSPKDLCTIDFLDDLVKAGIDSFKIEGRMRSPEYIKVTTHVYRKAIDLFFEGKLTEAVKQQLKEQLKSVYNRGFSTGFYFGEPKDATSRGLEHTHEKVFLGEVCRFFKKISVAEIKLRTRDLKKGEQILFIGNSTPAEMVTVSEIQKEHKDLEWAEKGEVVGVKLPFMVRPRDKVFIWRRKSL